jgi:hypothetical protein
MKMKFCRVLAGAIAVLASPISLERSSEDVILLQNSEAMIRDNFRLVKLSDEETQWVSEEQIDSFRRVSTG